MTWFDLNQEHEDLNSVLDFVDRVSENLEYIFNQDSFRELLDNDYDAYKISASLFFDALDNAAKNLRDEVAIFRDRIDKDNLDYDERYVKNANYILTQIGFTGETLTLKANVLNKLWDGVLRAGDGIISFARNPIVKAIRKLLAYLNSLLGSLTKLIPGVDGIKEIKEIGESYLNVADE